MCEKCVRKGKRAKVSYGKIKVLAHRLLNGEPIPMFGNLASNYAVEGHLFKIQRKKTERRYRRKGRRIQ